ncbi:histone-lysine N-methyltransferase SETMAR [Trichonephila clavipes]|nr:histone-lysine N-methyltransferase SETMAR [Trichonephila clavipes]
MDDNTRLHRVNIINKCLQSEDITRMDCCELQGVKNGSQQRENSVLFTVFFNKGENASQVVEIAKGIYGLDTVTADYMQFWFRRLHSGIFDVKDAPRTSRPVVENVDKIPEIIEVDRHVSSRSIAQELKINHKTVFSHLRKVGFKKMLHVWVSHQLTPKNMMDRISICETLAKRNEIDPLLKRMVIGNEKRVTYYNIVRKRSWSKCGEAAQTVAKLGLTTIKVLPCIWWDWKGIIY